MRGAQRLDRRGIVCGGFEDPDEHRRRIGIGIGGLGAARRPQPPGTCLARRPAASQWAATTAASAPPLGRRRQTRMQQGPPPGRELGRERLAQEVMGEAEAAAGGDDQLQRLGPLQGGDGIERRERGRAFSKRASNGSPATLAASSTRCTGSPARRTLATTASRTEPGTGRPA